MECYPKKNKIWNSSSSLSSAMFLVRETWIVLCATCIQISGAKFLVRVSCTRKIGPSAISFNMMRVTTLHGREILIIVIDQLVFVTCISNSVRSRCCCRICLPVCLSVRPSVCQTRAPWQNEMIFCQHSYAVWEIDHSSLPDTKNGWWGRPLLRESLLKLTVPIQKRRLSIDIRS